MKIVLHTIISLVLAAQFLSAQQISKPTSPSEKSGGITDFIFNALKNAPDDRWCKHEFGKTFCGKKWKQEALQNGYGSYGVEIEPDKQSSLSSISDQPKKMRIALARGKKEDPFHFATSIWLEENQIGQFEKMGNSWNSFVEDKETRCHVTNEWQNEGKFFKMYVCKYYGSYEKFLDTMSSLKSADKQ